MDTSSSVPLPATLVSELDSSNMVVTEPATPVSELDSSNMVVTEPATSSSGLDSSNMVVTEPAIVEEDLDQQLPSPKKSICGIDYDYINTCIAGAVEDDELLGSTHLKSVVDNVFVRADFRSFSSSRIGMMHHLKNDNVSDCCIGIPVHYTCEERRKLLRDVTTGGWRPCKLLHKTTAVALMYRFSSADLLQDDTLLNIAFIIMSEYDDMQVDMQVSIVELKKDQLKVLSYAHEEFRPLLEIDGVKIVLHNALNESGIRVDDVHSVQVLREGLGGPSFVTESWNFFRKEPMETISKSYPVAVGCFIQCAMLCGAHEIPKFQIVDILPYLVELYDGTETQVLFSKGHPIIPSIKSVTFHRRSTFFLDLIFRVYHYPHTFSYMIGPFDCNTEKEVNVKVQLDLHGISSIQSATLDDSTIVPVVEYERAGPQAEQHKLLIDSTKHIKEFLTIQAERRIVTDKIIGDDRIEKEKLRKSKVALEIQLTESNARLETTTKQHEKSQSVLLDKVQIAEKKLVDISAQLKDSLNEVNNLRETIEWQSGFVNFTLFSLTELERATDGFNNLRKIGEGGYGSVYKGTLQNKEVAIKILNNESLQEEAEFTQEVQILTQVRHPNIIKLIGASREACAFIFEFAPNGSLNTLLTDRKNSSLKFDWQDRIRIASEICSALIFLHSIPPHGIAHGDLKPDNILLDSDFVSKLCDFGISRKLQKIGQRTTLRHLTEDQKFTPAYADPEYISSGELTPQSDIYSFGIILMQLVTGKEPKGIMSIVDEALEEDKLDTIVDGSAGEWPIEKAKQLAQLGLKCTAQFKRRRPNLVKVVLPLLNSMKLVVSEPGSTLKESVISGSSVS